MMYKSLRLGLLELGGDTAFASNVMATPLWLVLR